MQAKNNPEDGSGGGNAGADGGGGSGSGSSWDGVLGVGGSGDVRNEQVKSNHIIGLYQELLLSTSQFHKSKSIKLISKQTSKYFLPIRASKRISVYTVPSFQM